MNNENGNMTADSLLFQPLVRTGRWYYTTVGILSAIAAWGLTAWIYQLAFGLRVTGMNRPVFWGVYITNFVFFIGISHAGTLISAILRITQAEWRRPFTRAAEAITVFSLPFGALSIIIDMGRPDRILNVFRLGRYQSALLWDITAIGTYLISSVVFFYLALIPDIAMCRDRLQNVSGFRKRLYKTLSFGWTGTEEQKRRLNMAIAGIAIWLFMVVVTVHTVVAFVFGMTIQPGWHSTVIGPYFLLGAIFSGVAAVIIAMAILRRVFHLEDYIKPIHFNKIGLFLLVLTLFWFYFTVVEYLTTFYGNEIEHMAVFNSKFFGKFSPLFWLMVFLCFVIPTIILVNRRTRTIGGTVIASISICIGMWLERFTVVVPSLARPRVPYPSGIYHPTWVEWSITAGCFAAFILLLVIFAKFFPIVSVWEIQEGRGKAVQETTERLETYQPSTM